jgi:hypothetical protein
VFDTQRVLNKLVGRVGWKQPTQPEQQSLVSATNQASKSGRYFQDVHPQVSLQRIKAAIEDVAISDEDFSAYLQDLTKASILKALNGIFNRPEVIETDMLFERNERQTQVVTPNADKFVGYQFEIVNNPDFATKISSVALYFDSAVTFTLYLFSDTRRTPLWSKAVTTVANDLTIVDLDDCVLTYLADNNRSGRYYFGYYTNDLAAAKPYNEMVTGWNRGCLYRYLSVEANATPDPFDINHYGSTGNTFGFNLEVTSYRDYTARIIANAPLFDEIQCLQVAADVLELIINSNRSNIDERLSKETAGRIYNDLNLAMSTEEYPYSTGFKSKINRELNKLNKAFFENKTPRLTSYTTPTC